MHHYHKLISYLGDVKNIFSDVCGISGPKFLIFPITLMLLLVVKLQKSANGWLYHFNVYAPIVMVHTPN
jgi:hypothetical protein